MHCAPTAPHQHPPSRHNCPAQDSACKGCGEKGHWPAKYCSSNTTSLQASHHQPHFKSRGKGTETQAAKAKTEKRSLHKDLFIATIDCGTVGDMHPKEMIIDNISSKWCNEAYTVIKLPASASSKGTALVHVKIVTGSGGNILPLHLFQQLDLKQTTPDSLPIGLACLNQANCLQWVSESSVQNPPWPHPLATKHSWSPTTYDPLILVCHRHTSPALLGLPACERLAVVQVNCAVMATQHCRSLTGTAPTQAARVGKPPTAKTPKSKCIKSTDDLMREFPDRFTGIGKLPGEYKIQLYPDTHPVIHAPRKCPIALCPKV